MRHTAGCGNAFSASWSEKGKAGPVLLDPTDSQRKQRQGVSLNENKNNDRYSYYWTNTVTPVLAWLHWHPVSFRVNLNILLIVFRILNRLACPPPPYLSALINVHTPFRALRSANQKINKKNRGHRAFQLLPWVSWMCFYFIIDLP